MPVRRHPIALARSSTLLEPLPIDLALVARLRATYTRVRAHEHKLADLFYAKLFAAAPSLRPMFRSDVASQAQKLTAALDAVVNTLERPAETAAIVAQLGKRHAAYGAQPEHYALVIDLLVDSIREVLGPDANPLALDEWRTALRLISNQMLAAATPDPTPPTPTT